MKVSDLNPAYESLYFCCLEDWSDEMKEAGNHKEIWYNKMKDKGLRVKLAFDDNGTVGGMIQYIPIEHSFVHGRDLYFVLCIWVHGYKQGRGNFRKQGMGKVLINAAEEDVRQLGGKGLVVWGLSLPFFMRASWFKKQGYIKVDKNGMMVLLWKKFLEDAEPPKWIKEKIKPEPLTDKVKVTGFINGWCPAMNMIFERAKKTSAEFGDKVVFEEISTFEKEKILEYGICDAVFVNDKEIRTGPPPTYKKIKRTIEKQVKKIKT